MERPKRTRRLFATPMLLLLAVLATAGLWDECKEVGREASICVNAGDGSGSSETCRYGGGGGGGGRGGGTPAATYPPQATATSIPTPGATPIAQLFEIAAYTYSENQCWQGEEIDPINVVFAGMATVPIVLLHADHHGAWSHHDGTAQSFWENGNCLAMDGQAASDPSLWFPGRFHMRFLVKSGTLMDTIAVADAHHEDMGVCDFVPKHVVDHEDDNGGVSGFDMGRNDILSDWEAGGHAVTVVPWPNTRPMMQCDGRTSESDGRTVFVSIVN